MHAIYYFLTEIDDFVDANDLVNAIDHDICSYAANWCDENNGWSILGAVLLDDRRLDLSSKPHLHTAPGAWHGACKQAYQAVASEMLVWYADRRPLATKWASHPSPDDAILTATAVRLRPKPGAAPHRSRKSPAGTI